MRGPIIAIDGPSGAGKGTVARALARALDYGHVDTGAMYRALGWKALQAGLPPSLDDEEDVVRLAEDAQFVLEAGKTLVDGIDVTQAIRTPEIDQAAARVAGLPRVRDVLVARQRELGRAGRIVMEGRDIGTVVFPDADVKIFLDATPEERARRRAADAAHALSATALPQVAEALRLRDELDRTRRASPLAVAADAVLVDTTGVKVEDVVARVVEVVRRKLEGSRFGL